MTRARLFINPSCGCKPSPDQRSREAPGPSVARRAVGDFLKNRLRAFDRIAETMVSFTKRMDFPDRKISLSLFAIGCLIGCGSTGHAEGPDSTQSSFSDLLVAVPFAAKNSIALSAQKTKTSQTNLGQTSAETVSSSTLATHQIDLNSEALWASGLALTESSGAYRQLGSKTELNLAVSYATIDLDYKPADFDLISRPVNLSERRLAGQAGIKGKVTTSLSLLASGGVYDGYANYRTLWLNEYYRQYFFGVPGYKTITPGGYNLSGGIRWEYQPAAGFLQLEVLYSRDDVPSGYEVVVRTPPQIGTDLVRSSDRLYTTGARLSLENVLSRRVRLLNEIQIADTTDRDPRFSYQGSMNWAMAEHWVLRSMLGLSKEEPSFHSYSFGATLEYDWAQKWFVSLFGRYYKDNGEIDNPLLFNVAAPALETFQIGAGFRWQGEHWSAKFVIGPYFTRYASVEADVKPFEKLYRNRDWKLAQASLSYSF